MKHARHELWSSAEVSRLVALLSSERDYLESILCVVATAATSQVMIGDGAAPAIVILPNNVGGGVGTYPVPLGITSKTGSWRVTTAAGVSIIASGNFS